MKICKADVRIKTNFKNIGPWLPIIETNKFIGPIIGQKKLENMTGKKIKPHQTYSKVWHMELKILLLIMLLEIFIGPILIINGLWLRIRKVFHLILAIKYCPYHMDHTMRLYESNCMTEIKSFLPFLCSFLVNQIEILPDILSKNRILPSKNH